ncbi:hypothetical protein C7M84_011567, partial [Penaeus vannamei]
MTSPATRLPLVPQAAKALLRITRAEVLSLLDVQKNALCDTLDHIARSNNEAIDRVLRMNNDATAKIGELTKSLDGLPEDKNETWEKSQSRVAAFLQRHFQLTPEFERVHRVGTLTRNAAPRDIVVRFTRYTDRDAVFQDRRKLGNTRTGVYINEDLCRNSLEMRKAQMPALRAAKRDGKVAYFNYRKLVIKERQRSVRPREPSRQTAPSVPSAPSSPPASPFMQRAPHFPSDSAWGQQEPRTPTAHRPCTQPHSSSSVTLVFPTRDASSATLSASSATDVDAATTLTETSGAFLASTSVSVASNAMDASGATDADAPGATHDAAASIATDSSSSTMAAGAVGATTGGLPPRSSHTTSNQQTHKLGTTHGSNAGMALRSKPTGTRKKQL